MNRKLKTAAFIEKLPACAEQQKRAHLEWQWTPACKLADQIRETIRASPDYDAWRVYSLLGYIKGGTKDKEVLSAIDEALALFRKRIPFCRRFEKAMSTRNPHGKVSGFPLSTRPYKGVEMEKNPPDGRKQ